MSLMQLDDSPVIALLGPTNTGKTRIALERMLAHQSGVMGFPLRLLARENYARACRMKSVEQVALITGEEKIIPPRARWYFCTVEAMPVSQPFHFLAVDEIQLCTDPHRGHIFTERVLHARGTEETMFLGAETIQQCLRQLLPGLRIESRPRLSRLTYAGRSKISALPKRTAIVAFTLDDVYRIALNVRRAHGGTAMVVGALSPQARAAQVELFESKQVDYIVATDAIGMGLNMSIDHVAFAATQKFDGTLRRPLMDAELGQIAGRAGRYRNAGTFGTIDTVSELPQRTIRALESHRFPSAGHVFWRNHRLSYRSPLALLQSLRQKPNHPILQLVPPAEDQVMLAKLSRRPAVARLANTPMRVQLLWEVCQVPDFGGARNHDGFLTYLYTSLADGAEEHPVRLQTDVVMGHIRKIPMDADRIDGMLHAMAGIRRWNYLTQRQYWLRDAEHWQEVTRGMEEELSEKLHDRLQQRFIDPLARRRRIADEIESIDWRKHGEIAGLRFVLDPTTALPVRQRKRVMAEARKFLRDEGLAIASAEDTDLAIAPDMQGFVWRAHRIGAFRVSSTEDPLQPDIILTRNDLEDADVARRVLARLERRWKGQAEDVPYAQLMHAGATPALRVLAHGLICGGGVVARQDVRASIDRLPPRERKLLAQNGVTIGFYSVFIASLLTVPWRAIRRMLADLQLAAVLDALPLESTQPALPALPVARADPRISDALYSLAGYVVVGSAPHGGLAVEVVALERLTKHLHHALRADSPVPYAAAKTSKRLRIDPRLALPETPAEAGDAENPITMGELLRNLGYDVNEGGYVVRKQRGGKARLSTGEKAEPPAKNAAAKKPKRKKSPAAKPRSAAAEGHRMQLPE